MIILRFAALLYKLLITIAAGAIVAVLGVSYRYLGPLIQNGADSKYSPLLITYVLVLALMAVCALFLLLYHRRFYIQPLKAAAQHIRKVDINNPEI